MATYNNSFFDDLGKRFAQDAKGEFLEAPCNLSVKMPQPKGLGIGKTDKSGYTKRTKGATGRRSDPKCLSYKK